MLKKLFSPGVINTLELKNRICMPAMHLNYAVKGEMTERGIAFYERRAKGGAALVYVGVCNSQPPGVPFTFFDFSEDKFVPKMKELIDRVKAHGCAIGIQIAPMKYYGVPSNMPKVDELPDLVENMVIATARAKDAGFDIVEFLGSGGSLLSYMLSPVYNPGNIEGYSEDQKARMRFGVELIERTRKAVGDDYPLSVRIHGHEFLEGGYDNEAAKVHAKRFEQAGIDVINVTGGGHKTKVPQITMGVPRAAYAYLAAGVKEVVSVPVMASNRINEPRLAESILRRGDADYINFGRGLIGDPDLPIKAAEARFDEIATCIACNECMDQTFSGQSVSCTMNPLAGRETEFDLTKVDKPKKVFVAGGGPGGMSAARFLRERGHEVTLFEANDELGGKLPVAAVPPGREEMLEVKRFLKTMMKVLGVDVKLGTKLTADMVKEARPDAVIVATGTIERDSTIPGIENANAVSYWDVLEGRVDLGNKIVILGGGAVGCETALYVAEKGSIDAETARFLVASKAVKPEDVAKMTAKGKKVTIISRQDKMGKTIGKSSRWAILKEMRHMGVEMISNAKYKEANEKGIIIEDSGKERFIEADLLILASGHDPNNALAKELDGLVDQVLTVGDAKQPRHTYWATREGAEAAFKV